MTNIIESLEKDLAEAVARQEAIGYTIACDELGRTPEFPELYGQGQADIHFRDLNKKQNQGETDGGRYSLFYREGGRLSTSFEKDIVAKRKLLEKYFSKFGVEGKQPIRKLEPLKLGSLFSKMLKYSKNRVEQ